MILRKYFWLCVIVGVVLVSVLIVLIFLLVIKCIFRRENLCRGSSFINRNSKYEDRNIPSSTERTKFHNTETQSYENLSEAPNWCLQPDLNPATGQQDSSDSDQDPHDYELVGHPAAHDHDSEHSLPDYVSVENVSTEDYDDIGDDEEDCSEEDYDDVE